MWPPIRQELEEVLQTRTMSFEQRHLSGEILDIHETGAIELRTRGIFRLVLTG
jgi:hypothetical protein